jgi:type IX secretion system PorP/SprF family membrane protein
MKEKKVKKLEMLSRVIKMYRIGTISAAIMLVVLCDSKVDAQDLHFSQFQMTPLQMDASMAGKQGDYRIILNYKDQWRSVANPYKTFGFSLETAFNKKHNKDHFFGMGLSAFRDQAGDIGMGVLELELSGAYHIKVAPKQYLSAGLQAGFGQKSLDESALRYGNQYDGSGHNSSFASNEILTK